VKYQKSMLKLMEKVLLSNEGESQRRRYMRFKNMFLILCAFILVDSKFYKEEITSNINIFPGDLTRLPDDFFKYWRCL